MKEEIDIDLDLISEGDDITKLEEKKDDLMNKKKNKKSRSKSSSEHKKSKKHKKEKKKHKYRSHSKSRSRSHEKKRKEFHESIEVGKVYDGVVTNVHDYGCFV